MTRAQGDRLAAIRDRIEDVHAQTIRRLLSGGMERVPGSSFWTRFRSAAFDVGNVARAHGFVLGVRRLKGMVFRKVRTAVYVARCESGPSSGLPLSCEIRRVDEKGLETGKFALGLSEDRRNSRLGGVAYVAYMGGRAAAIGWIFPLSRQPLRMGYTKGSVYLGGFRTWPEFQRRGLYVALLTRMRQDSAPSAEWAVAETDPENIASRCGLEKAGFKFDGIATTRILAGFVMSCQVEKGATG
jgi:RimJ/RimL family protein N-acetyltransferase